MTNYSPYPRPDDVVYVEYRRISKRRLLGTEFVTEPSVVLQATFVDCDRPRDLAGFGDLEIQAIADLYKALRDYREE